MSPGPRARWMVRLFLGVLAACSAHGAGPPRHFFLELDIANERGGLAALLFDFGDGIWGENSVSAEVPAGNTPQTIRLRLPDRPIREVRFDPTPGEEVVLI